MSSYKSDAIALMSDIIDQETKSETPKGKDLEISEDDVKKIVSDVAVIDDTLPKDTDTDDVEPQE